jgi:hypothetical protein
MVVKEIVKGLVLFMHFSKLVNMLQLINKKCKSTKYVSIKFAKSNLQSALQFTISNVFIKGKAKME